jgi:chemotaxis protein methyltransferase CheR
MPSDAETLGLRTAAVILLRDLVHERTGLHYDNGRCDTMADRLAPLVLARGFGSFLDYYYFLKYDPGGDTEWVLVLDALSVTETYFWREIDQLRAIAHVVVPQLLQQTDVVRIWCVPCATGEEPLTLAMLLDQQGLFERGSIELRASDASEAALARARQGLYRERAFRVLPPHLRDLYFTPEKDGWRVAPRLHQRVLSWERVNLMDAADVRRRANVDVIFCRNVFIYFSETGVRRVVNTFADVMHTPGYLCVGAAESLLRVTTRFDLQEIAGAFVYVKGAQRGEQA